MGRPLRLWIALAAALLAVPAAGQDRGFRLEGLYPVGGRTSVTEAWGTLRFTVTNLDPTPHDLRVLVFYPEHPDVQYGRDVWVPANSTHELGDRRPGPRPGVRDRPGDQVPRL